jgi:uncharacterized membrane protein (DUF485 family)
MSTTEPARHTGGTSYEEVQNSAEFADLRRRFRRFVFPMCGLFLVWYFLYVLLSAYAPDFMSTKVFGNINIGLIFGLLQFVSTFTITMTYARWADREFDPTADRLRDHIESGEVR